MKKKIPTTETDHARTEVPLLSSEEEIHYLSYISRCGKSIPLFNNEFSQHDVGCLKFTKVFKLKTKIRIIPNCYKINSYYIQTIKMLDKR